MIIVLNNDLKVLKWDSLETFEMNQNLFLIRYFENIFKNINNQFKIS